MTREEYNQCVDLYADSLYRFILKSIKDKDLAKDIIQDTYEKLWLKISDVPSTNARSYMFTTAYRTMIDYIRKGKRNADFEEANLYIVDAEKPSHDLKKILDQALEKLPDIQRSVILLRDYEGYSYEEIGKITELTETQVKVYIFRARQTLKQYLGKVENLV